MRKVNGRFDVWAEKLPAQAKAALERRAGEIEKDPAIAHGHRNADYAKRAAVLRFARTLGFE